MSLLDRLRGIEQPRFNAHGFQAALSEWVEAAPSLPVDNLGSKAFPRES